MGIAKHTPLTYGLSMTIIAIVILIIDIVMKENEIILWGVVLLTGYILGGPVGIGTLISTFGTGLVMQFVYNIIKFEPRKLQHKDVKKVVNMLSNETDADSL